MATYLAGVNLGGWLSQYRQKDRRHFETFIQERDIQRIAAWGMDHVRVPVDYPVLESDEAPGQYLEEGFHFIDACLDWCRRAGLSVILDLHRAPGYSFGTLATNTLFTSPAAQERFVRLWLAIAERYRSWGDELQFELLNEMVDETSERWNGLAHRAIAAIRSVDARRVIVYGGNRYNDVNQLQNIALVQDDDRIVYTFHFYKPHLFTHQHASWSAIAKDYDEVVEYPGVLPHFDEFLAAHPHYGDRDEVSSVIDRAYMEQSLEPAVAFAQSTGKPLYCGEYGVIDLAPPMSRVNWHRDFTALLRRHGIGRAVWSYRAMSFGLVTLGDDIVSQELVEIVSRR